MSPETIKIYESYRANWQKCAPELKTLIRRECPDAEVYVFGSVIKGGAHPTSDIDVLIVSEGFRNIRKKVNSHTGLKLAFPIRSAV
ncbi:MAG: nucleotidyltransferase domain-containing protein [Deltaproteobacteria bacterium]